jgi:ubiquitin carboxyl-terminal hydrolase L5
VEANYSLANSFRKLDMLNTDLAQLQASKLRSTKKSAAVDDDAVAAYHFIAFVPVDGVVWQFDGLERQPQKVGKSNCDYVQRIF